MSILYNYVNREIFKHFGVIVVVVVSIANQPQSPPPPPNSKRPCHQGISDAPGALPDTMKLGWFNTLHILESRYHWKIGQCWMNVVRVEHLGFSGSFITNSHQ